MSNDMENRVRALEIRVDAIDALKNKAIGGWAVIVFLLGLFALPIIGLILRFLVKGVSS